MKSAFILILLAGCPKPEPTPREQYTELASQHPTRTTEQRLRFLEEIASRGSPVMREEVAIRMADLAWEEAAYRRTNDKPDVERWCSWAKALYASFLEDFPESEHREQADRGLDRARECAGE